MLGDKEIKNLARNMRKCCKKRDFCAPCILAKDISLCKYKRRYCDKITFDDLPDYMSIKELADELRRAGL